MVFNHLNYCFSVFCIMRSNSLYSCDVNLKDKEGCTPLHVAVLSNCPQVIKILVANGANTSFKDNAGKTALQHSMKKVGDCVARNSHSLCYHVLFYSGSD